jgi:hypothetical protein
VYAYNPNFVLDAGYVAKPGTVAGSIAAANGQVCAWVNETSGDELVVAITAVSPAAFAAAQSAASGGTPIDTDGNKGYFAVKDGIGSAQIFMGSIWLTVSSVEFATADDAAALYPVVVHNQRGAGG